MTSFLAHSNDTGRIILYAGSICMLLALFGSWAYAARRSIKWMFAVILFPPAILALMFKDSGYRNCVLLAVVSFAGAIWGVLGCDFWPKDMGLWERTQFVGRFFADSPRKERDEKVEEELRILRQSATIEQRQQVLRGWQQRLEARKAKLNPADRLEQRLFDADLKEYLEELEIVKADMARAGKR
jgi:hypothetical protein